MTKEQRKYLLDEINKVYNEQLRALQEKQPRKPSLNNLVAAFLDNSIVMKDGEKLKARIRDRVIKMGKADLLIVEADSFSYPRSRNGKEGDLVQLKAEDLFEYPENYLQALREYEELKNKIEQEIATLTAEFKTVTFKINISSNEALANLVSEADNLGTISLVNRTLMLANSPRKELSNSK